MAFRGIFQASDYCRFLIESQGWVFSCQSGIRLQEIYESIFLQTYVDIFLYIQYPVLMGSQSMLHNIIWWLFHQSFV